MNKVLKNLPYFLYLFPHTFRYSPPLDTVSWLSRQDCISLTPLWSQDLVFPHQDIKFHGVLFLHYSADPDLTRILPPFRLLCERRPLIHQSWVRGPSRSLPSSFSENDQVSVEQSPRVCTFRPHQDYVRVGPNWPKRRKEREKTRLRPPSWTTEETQETRTKETRVKDKGYLGLFIHLWSLLQTVITFPGRDLLWKIIHFVE